MMRVLSVENRPFVSYLVFFYSFGFALIICYILLSILNIKPEPLSDFTDILPIFYGNFIPQGYKMKLYPLSFGIIIFSTLSLYFLLHKIVYKYPQISPLFVPFAFFSILLLPLLHIKTIMVAIEYLKQFSYIFKISPVIESPTHVVSFIFGLSCLLALYFFYEKIQVSLRKFGHLFTKFIPALALVLILVTLFDRKFEENLLFYGPVGQYVHTIPIIAAIQDVLMGKVLLVNANSEYGLLLVYANAIVFKFIPLAFTSFFYLMITYGILYYLVAFTFLKLRLKSNLWGLVGLIPLFSLHFYAVFDRYIRPMTFPMRYLLDLPFFLLLLKISDTKRRWLRNLLPLYLSLAFYYNYESGISLTISFLFYLFLSHRGKIVDLSVNYAKILFWIASLAALYSLYAKLASGYFPDWQNALFYIKIHSLGIDAEGPPPTVGLHFYTWSIYFIVLIKSLIAYIQKRLENIWILDATLALYGFIISIYFIKSPYILNLAVTGIPAIILSIILFKDLFEYAVLKRSHHPISLPGLTFLTPYIVLGSILVFSITFYISRLSVAPVHDYWPYMPYRSQAYKFYDEANLASSALAKYEKDKKSVALLSYYDGFIRLKANKLNSLPITNFQMVLTKSHVKSLYDQLTKLAPEYIYADNDSLQISVHRGYLRYFIVPELYEYIYKYYHKIDTVGFLDVWQKNAT